MGHDRFSPIVQRRRRCTALITSPREPSGNAHITTRKSGNGHHAAQHNAGQPNTTPRGKAAEERRLPMRPVALGRKNALFADSNEGAENWAAVASLIETAKLNGGDPQRYLTNLLTRLVSGWPQSRIDELMPWCWATQAKG